MLEATQLTKTYGEHTALRNLNLAVPKGEIFCLLGQNGAGKTTTINLFLGFTAASSGSAAINGMEVKPTSTATKRFISYIPEVVMLYGNLSGIENLDFFSRLAGFRYGADLLKNFLSQAGLQQEAHKKRLGTYSKGMRQKVGLAIALAKRADVILMATHDIFNAVNVGTRIGIMKEGSLVHTLRTNDVRPASCKPFTWKQSRPSYKFSCAAIHRCCFYSWPVLLSHNQNI